MFGVVEEGGHKALLVSRIEDQGGTEVSGFTKAVLGASVSHLSLIHI